MNAVIIAELRNILIVEEDLQLRHTIKCVLIAEGYEVVPTKSSLSFDIK